MSHRIARVFGLIVAAATLAACSTSGDSQRGSAPPGAAAPRPVSSPSALDAAHEAYLSGDFLAMSERVRDVILDPGSSELVKENAYALLDKAYESKHGQLPSRFTLPAGYVDLQYGAIRGMTKNGPFYRVFCRGRALDANHLAGLTLKRLPDEVILDKQTKKGSFDLRDDEPGYKDFVLEAKVPALPADGVFTIRLELDDGTVSEGWFVGHGLESSASPEVKSPSPSATLSDPNPVVSWVPFHSPEFVAFEGTTFNVWVGRDGDDADHWSFWTAEPGSLAAVRIGAQPGSPTKKLTAGDYWLSVGNAEIRKFGPIHINRGSSTVLPFHVVP